MQPRANAVIVGSHFKRDGGWRNPIDEARVREFTREVVVRRAG